MAIIVKTKVSPKKLIDKLNEKINRESIITWIVDEDGDYTHTPAQWMYRAWFKAREGGDQTIVFGLVESRKYTLTKELYAVYHGRFAEMLLAHFDGDIEDIAIRPLLDKNLDYFD